MIALAAAVLSSSGVSSTRTITLNNGIEMPIVLYGSGGAHTQDNVTATAIAVALALSPLIGFLGVDGANHYHNQIGVRDGVAASGTPRSKLWLQTKVEPCGHSIVREGHCYDDTIASFAQNLQQLNVDAVDMTLLHAPPCAPHSTWADAQCVWDSQIYPHNCDCKAAAPCEMMRQQWSALEAMYFANKTRGIGVSNFCPACLQCLAGGKASPHPASNGKVTVPAVNQLQFHAGMSSADPRGLLSYTRSLGTVVQAYSPLGGEQAGPLLTSPVTKAIGAAHNKSSAQVVLRWIVQLGHTLTAATMSKEHMLGDLDVFEWELTDAEMAKVTALDVAPDDPTKEMCRYD